MDPDPAYDPVTGDEFGFEFEFASVSAVEANDDNNDNGDDDDFEEIASVSSDGGCDTFAGVGVVGLLLAALFGLKRLRT